VPINLASNGRPRESFRTDCAVETLSELHLTTQDTAAWGMVLWAWQKAFTLRRPDRATEHGLDAVFASARAVSESVKEVLPNDDTAGAKLVAAFQCTGPLAQFWLLFQDCVVAFRAAKKELMLSVWEQLSDTELHVCTRLLCMSFFAHSASSLFCPRARPSSSYHRMLHLM
jgi:hypothetical protein